MPEFEEFSFDSSTGSSRIRAIKLVPDGEIKGIVQIVHGIAEHIDRYRGFMEFLAANGWLAAGCDNLGHGKSIAREEDIGVFFPTDGWTHVVRDVLALHDLLVSEYPVRHVLFGHSLGSFLAREYISDYPDAFDMAVLSGTGHQPRPVVLAGNAIARLIVRTKGYDSDGSFLSGLTMGGYLKRIPDAATPYDWLTHDSEIVKAYAGDELCGFVAKAGLYADMLTGIRNVTSPVFIARIPADKPVCFLSGTDDPVGEYGKGVRRAYSAFKKAGIKDVTLRLYEGGRHEMLNELNRTEVFGDLLAWLNSHAV